jgi:hypothetical protein
VRYRVDRISKVRLATVLKSGRVGRVGFSVSRLEWDEIDGIKNVKKVSGAAKTAKKSHSTLYPTLPVQVDTPSTVIR